MKAAESLWRDIRAALRVLSKSPGTTVLSVLSVALGIGLTTSMFSVGDAMMLRPLAVERPGELYELTSRGDDGQAVHYGWPDYEDMRGAGAHLVELAAYERRGALLEAGDEAVPILAYAVTPNIFGLLGVKAQLGRATVEPTGGQPAVVLGQGLWRRRFGGDPQIVGKTVALTRRSFVVAGVLPAEFTGLVPGVANDVWVSTDAWFEVLGNRRERQMRDGQFEIVARLKPGVSRERAASQLDAAIRGEGKRKPARAGAPGSVLTRAFAAGWRDSLIAGSGLLAVLGLVLFVACANAAQLRLAHAESRKSELGVRLALGAGTRRVAMLLFVETALISALGAALGVLLAQFLMRKTAEFIASGRSYIDYGIRLDYRVLLFVLAATLVSVLLAGLAPVRHAVGMRVAEILKSGYGVGAAKSGRPRRVLVTGQLAASVAFFGMAVLFLRSFQSVVAVRPGLDPGKKLLIVSAGRGQRMQAAVWCEQLCERLAALPGVRGATYARRVPLSGTGGGARVRVQVDGQSPMGVGFNSVGGNYFAVMGTRLVAGRGIDPTDRAGSQPVVVVSGLLARQLFGNRSAAGEWIWIEGVQRQIVGVAEDGPLNHLHEELVPHLYVPFAQMPSGDTTLLVETTGKPSLLTQAARQEIRRFDPGAVIFSTTTLEEHMALARGRDRMMATAASGVGVVAILLTALGLFGVIQYAVGRRGREMGLRLALGARPGDVRRMVLVEALRTAAWGIPPGLLLLGAAAWYVRSFVFGVSATDPLLYLTAAAGAVGIALAASWLPAARAGRLDPMTALRLQ